MGTILEWVITINPDMGYGVYFMAMFHKRVSWDVHPSIHTQKWGLKQQMVMECERWNDGGFSTHVDFCLCMEYPLVI